MSSRDYYHSHSSSSSRREGRDTLPNIHDTFGDLLSQPARPGYNTPHTSSTSRSSTNDAHHRTHSQEYHDPYAHSHGSSHAHQVVASGPRGHSTQSPARSGHHAHGGPPVGQRHQQQSSCMYGVFRSMPDGGLVEQNERGSRSSAREETPKKHVCPQCGESFSRPSILTVHQRKHSGEKPFVCEFPGCGRSFPVKSNMRRHLRTHNAESAFEYVDEDEEDYSESYQPQAAPSSSSSFRHGGGSSNQQPSSQYYTSSRRI